MDGLPAAGPAHERTWRSASYHRLAGSPLAQVDLAGKVLSIYFPNRLDFPPSQSSPAFPHAASRALPEHVPLKDLTHHGS